MKKILLVLAFVFASGSLVNANNNSEIVLVGDCNEYANISQWAAQMSGYTWEESIGVWLGAYDTCVAYQMANLQEVHEDENIDPADDPK